MDKGERGIEIGQTVLGLKPGMAINMKGCRKCGHGMPLTGFYTHKKSKDGYQSWCKRCQQKDGIERNREMKRKRTAKQKAMAKAQSKRMKAYWDRKKNGDWKAAKPEGASNYIVMGMSGVRMEIVTATTIENKTVLFVK